MTSEPSDDDGAQDAAAAAVAPAAVVRLRLDLGYDGSGFHGWAVQPGRRTVAGVLTDALTTLLRVPVRVVVAGRTDAGVHASGQVAHVDVPEPALVALSPRARGGAAEQDVAAGCRGLLRRLAGLLPADVRVRRVAPAPDGFDARFAALRRHYRYRISTAAWGADPLDRVACWPLGRPLDVEAMSRAAAALLGLHDFAAYCRPRPDATGRPATTVRELQRLAVERVGDEVVLHVSADAFCHSMVRSLVGVLVRVGEGREPVAAPARLLAAGERSSRVATAPACGLTLTGVDYPDDAELAARVAVTRAVREPLDDGPTG